MTYSEEVTLLLAKEFDLDDITSAVLMDVVLVSMRRDTDHIEFILDNPCSANWRLKMNYPWEPKGLRLSCYKAFPTAEDSAREERVNTELSTLANRSFTDSWFPPSFLASVWMLVAFQIVLAAIVLALLALLL